VIRLALLCITLLWAQGAGATQDAWPALYDVTGVAADDVLNVRAAPDASAEIIGTLKPDATNVEVIEPSERQGWGRVNTGGRSGWASLRFLQRQPGQWYGKIPQIRSCFGTEPFWHMRVTPGGEGEWATPEATAPLSLDPGTGSENHRGHSVFLGRSGDTEFTVLVRYAQCSDGMSDQHFGLAADILRRPDRGAPELLTGCCSLVP
jgi:hypothetical protein